MGRKEGEKITLREKKNTKLCPLFHSFTLIIKI